MWGFLLLMPGIIDRIQSVLDRIRELGEISEHNLPAPIRAQLAGYTRVRSYRKNGLRNSLIVWLILVLFAAGLAILSQRWAVLLGGIIVGTIFFVIVYMIYPTYCPICFGEMHEIKREEYRIIFNCCTRCKTYARVRPIPRNDS